MQSLTRVALQRAVLLATLAMASSSQAIIIDIDYQHDTFFTSNPTARAAIEAAADDLSDAITSSLSPILTDTYSGNSGDAMVNTTWSYSYTNPETGSSISIPTTANANRVTIFVGGRNLPNSTVGTANFSSIGFNTQISATSNTTIASKQAAISQSAATSSLALGRGGGPTLSTFDTTLTFNFNGTLETYDFNATVGLAYGSMWFDWDEDNNGVRDSSSSLDDYWHWNHTTPVASGKVDLYSIALHEIMHSLGLGSSDSWEALVSGTNWLGTDASALSGGGDGIIAADQAHITNGLMSPRLSDGVMQEVVMDPNLTNGTRKELTLLDLAFLRDIGWETITVNAPGDYDGNGVVEAADYVVWKGQFGATGSQSADGNGDGVVDAADYTVWRDNYTASGSLSAPGLVPEPAALALLLLASLPLLRRRR